MLLLALRAHPYTSTFRTSPGNSSHPHPILIPSSPSNAAMEDVDRNQRSPLHAASLGGFLDPVQQLLLARSEVHGQDRDGHTALHVAAEAGHVQVGLKGWA